MRIIFRIMSGGLGRCPSILWYYWEGGTSGCLRRLSFLLLRQTGMLIYCRFVLCKDHSVATIKTTIFVQHQILVACSTVEAREVADRSESSFRLSRSRHRGIRTIIMGYGLIWFCGVCRLRQTMVVDLLFTMRKIRA